MCTTRLRNHPRQVRIYVTDGEPDNQNAVIETLSNASLRLHPKDNLAVHFIQIGHDASATQFLKNLDENLVSNRKLPYDFVKTIKIGDMERQGITQTILNLINETAKSKSLFPKWLKSA